MPSIADTRSALKASIGEVMRCYDFFPQQLQPPCAVVGLPTNYDVNDSLGDTATMIIPVNVYVPYASNRAAEDALERLLQTSGADSVTAAIHATGENYGVTAVRDFSIAETTQGQPMALSCTIEVVVYA